MYMPIGTGRILLYHLYVFGFNVFHMVRLLTQTLMSKVQVQQVLLTNPMDTRMRKMEHHPSRPYRRVGRYRHQVCIKIYQILAFHQPQMKRNAGYTVRMACMQGERERESHQRGAHAYCGCVATIRFHAAGVSVRNFAILFAHESIASHHSIAPIITNPITIVAVDTHNLRKPPTT